MTSLLVLVLVMALLSWAAARYGADSRDSGGRSSFRSGTDRPPRRHTVLGDLVGLGSRVARAAARPRRASDERALAAAAQEDHSQCPRATTSSV